MLNRGSDRARTKRGIDMPVGIVSHLQHGPAPLHCMYILILTIVDETVKT